MGSFFGFIGGLYMIGIFVFWAIFWWTKTDRSRSPFERRMIALGHAFLWPYYAYQFFAGRKQVAAKQQQDREAAQRIFGDAPSSPPAGGSAPIDTTRRVANPFDN